jgi:ATP-binding cassette subfamily B protein
VTADAFTQSAPPSPTPARPPGVLKICWTFVRLSFRRWRALLGVVVTLIAESALNIVKPWPLAILVDNVLGGHALTGWKHGVFDALPGGLSHSALLNWVVIASLLVFALDWAVTLLGDYSRLGFGQRLVYDVAETIFDHLQRLSLRFHNRHGVGDSIRRITSDSSCASTIVVDAILPVFASILTLGGMVLVMWRLDTELALVALSVVPVLIILIARYAEPMAQRGYDLEVAESEMYDHVERTLSGILVVQAFSGEARADAEMADATDGVLDAAVKEIDIQLRFKILTGLAMAFGTAAVFWIGAHHALSGRLSTGAVIVFVSYLYSLYEPLESLMYTSSTVQGAAGSARRILEVLEADREVVDRPGALVLPGVRGEVVLEGVGFGYVPGVWVLRDVDLRVGAGETVAIVGATGAGKSTLVSLIPRFYDVSAGRVLVDGHDVRDVQVLSLRRQISVVLQDSFLFPMSVAENIAYGRPDASRAEVEGAARVANADGFIRALPDGYDTLVGERGATLSGGERQRVAIARALLKDAPILILDEPTSALDARTEYELLEALDRLMVGRTTLVIAHRLSTIRNADRIVTLDHGHITQVGSHEQLLAEPGLYADLHALQDGPGPPS